MARLLEKAALAFLRSCKIIRAAHGLGACQGSYTLSGDIRGTVAGPAAFGDDAGGLWRAREELARRNGGFRISRFP